LLEGGLFGGQTFVIFIRQIDRTDGGTLTAAGTFRKINIARILTDAGFEFSRFAFKF
jgi:hypothetical protein